jgi:hypothetical protein
MHAAMPGNGHGPPKIDKPCSEALAQSTSAGRVVCTDGTATYEEGDLIGAWAKIYAPSEAANAPANPPGDAVRLDIGSGGFHKDALLLPAGDEFVIVVWVLWSIEGGASGSSGEYHMQKCSKAFEVGSVGSATDCNPGGSCDDRGGGDDDLTQQVHWLTRALGEKELEIQRLKDELRQLQENRRH